MSTETSLQDALAAAEAELDALSAQAKEAYRHFRKVDGQQTAKADEIRALKQQIREECQLCPP